MPPLPRDGDGRDADPCAWLPGHLVGRVLTGDVGDTRRRDRVVTVKLTVGREDVSGGVEDHDERGEAYGHIDRGRPDEGGRWRSGVEGTGGVLRQLELRVVGSHPEVLLDRRVDEATAQGGEDRDRQEEGQGATDDERAHPDRSRWRSGQRRRRLSRNHATMTTTTTAMTTSSANVPLNLKPRIVTASRSKRDTSNALSLPT